MRGIVTTDHLVPSQCMARPSAEIESPTAQTSSADTAETAWITFELAPTCGIGITDHDAPSQCIVNASWRGRAGSPYSPTAQTSRAEVPTTSSRKLLVAPFAPFGLGTVVQV